jgi:hypothetical protein
MSLRQHKIAVIAGDGEWNLCRSNLTLTDQRTGIGIEVTASALEALRAVEKKVGGFKLNFEELDYGSEWISMVLHICRRPLTMSQVLGIRPKEHTPLKDGLTA